MKSLVFISAVLLFALNTYAQLDPEKTYEADIKFNENGQTMIINAMVKNQSTQPLPIAYQLLIGKTSESNNISNNLQRGRKLIQGNDFESLSKVMLNFNYGDKIEAELKLYSSTNELLETIVKTIENNKEETTESANKQQQIYIDGVTTIGVVINETFSKLGKDFFDYFFSTYNLNYREAPYDIIIKESPHMGRTTKITVTFEDDLLYEFSSNPNQEFLEQSANYVVSLIQQKIQRMNELGINTKTIS